MLIGAHRLLAGAGGILGLCFATLLAGCGGSGGPPALAQAQTISFAPPPALTLHGTARIAATASSGLSVNYTSTTPSVCSVDGASGLVTDLAAGVCNIAASQSGSSDWVPAQATLSLPVSGSATQVLQFGASSPLTLGGAQTVSATASSGLAVAYASLTPEVCTVDAITGLVTDQTIGDCIIAANQGGNSLYQPAAQVTQTLTVSSPIAANTPGAPIGVTATPGASLDTVVVMATAVDSGGSPVTGYSVQSVPAGLAAQVKATVPVVKVQCPSSCAGYAFTLRAINAMGNGAASTAAGVSASYQVTATFYEPDTQPNNTIFTGSLRFDFTTRTVSGLAGTLTESMTGPPMNTVALAYQLSAVPDSTNSGLLVAAFALDSSNTFVVTNDNQGWLPGPAQYARYSGFPSAPNPASGGTGNAYVRLFINTTDPTLPPTQAQINELAYADCTAGGMMGAVCMTGTSATVYGTSGSMSGYPISQTVRRQ